MIRPVNIRLVRFDVVDSHRQALDVAGGAIRLEFFQLGATIPNRPIYRGSSELNPGVRTRLEDAANDDCGRSNSRTKSQNRVGHPVP